MLAHRILIIGLLLFPFNAVASECESITEKTGVALKRCGNLSVLYLTGKPVERARAAGELMREGGPLTPAVVHYFAEKVSDAVPPGASLARLGFNLIYNQIVRLLHRALPPAQSEEIDALASGMGLEGITLRRAISLADAAAGLNALGSLGPLRSLPAAGCTSVAAADESGNFVYGRNLDFAGAELWDRHPLLTVISPEPGSSDLKHLIFGADGVIFGGITGANEAGITFAVQQNYSKDASLSGVPMMFVGELVLRQARNLAEAEVLLRKYRPAFLWTFLLSDLKTGEAISVESSSRHFSVRRMESHGLVQTNHVMSEETKNEESISLGTKMNSIYRMKKAFESLEALPGNGATMEAVAKILAHQDNPEGEIQAYRDVLKAHTIQTVILEAKSGSPASFYVSMDAAPTSGGRYAKFSFSEIFAGPGSLRFEISDPLRTPLAKRQKQREISQAFHAYFDEHNIPKAASFLANHHTLDAELFRSIALYQEKRFHESLSAATNALSNPRFLGEPAYILQSLQWVRLASLQLLSRENESRQGEAVSLAERLLTEGEGPANPRLAELAREIAAGRTPHPSLLTLTFEFFSGDIGGRAN